MFTKNTNIINQINDVFLNPLPNILSRFFYLIYTRLLIKYFSDSQIKNKPRFMIFYYLFHFRHSIIKLSVCHIHILVTNWSLLFLSPSWTLTLPITSAFSLVRVYNLTSWHPKQSDCECEKLRKVECQNAATLLFPVNHNANPNATKAGGGILWQWWCELPHPARC